MSNKGQAGSGCGAREKCLTVCPANVKEAIDWVICLTGNNGCHCPKQPKGAPNECVENVAKEVWNILIGAAGSGATPEIWSWDELDMTNDLDSSNKTEKGGNYVKELIDELGKKLASFIGCINCTQTSCGICPKKGACGLAGVGYTYCYSSASECCVHSDKTQQKGCAKILLGCMPLIFSSLTYLFWNCRDNGKIWKDCDLNSSSKGPLCTYLLTLGYNTEQLKECKGSEIKSLLCCFSELEDCLMGKQPTELSKKDPESYAEFVDNIQNSFTSNDQKGGKKMPLQRLYMGAIFYFQATQAKYNQTLDKSKRPESIYELLYWLLGLPYTPVGAEVQTRSLESILEDYGMKNTGTADSCDYLPSEKCCKSPYTSGGCPMTPADADSYLLPACYYSAIVLLSILGKLVPEKTTTVQQQSSSGGSDTQRTSSAGRNGGQQRGPFLHDLYTNQHFEFYYPSSIRSWAVMLWDVVYALYFHLGFLYRRCKLDYKTGYGWKECAYGKDVKCYESQTWVCTNTKSPDAQHDECGKEPNKYSPLQGYLSDKLKDFRCMKKDLESESKTESELDSKSYCTHLDHRPPSQWCPIPMGFEKNIENLTSQRKGGHLSEILALYFEEKTDGSSLYQLLLFVGIVSLRPPRCLGDMFAFFCGIGGLCDAAPPQQDKSLDKLWEEKISGYPGTPNPQEITKPLKTLAGCCTKPAPPKHTSDSLCSLSQPSGCKCTCCTKYLCPLSWSVYTVFAMRHIESYFSWVVYMIDDLKSNLKTFLNAFVDVDCKSGCTGCKNDQKCHKTDTTGGCQCKVVDCKDILGALYRFGFTYQDASSLESNDKKCSEFLQQLKNVAEGSSLEELIKAVNQMLYSIRLAFIFWAWLLWTAAIVYLIFGLVVDLDILHIRSHIWLKHTHNIPAFNLFAARRLKHGIQVYFSR